MLINNPLKTMSSYVPVVGSLYGFTKTCVRVYNATIPSKALIAGVKGIVIDCTPPVVKFPLLCATGLACGSCKCITGDPNFAVGAIECCTTIIEG